MAALEDIEDFDVGVDTERVPKGTRGVRVRRRLPKEEEHSQPPAQVPGTQAIYVKTYGCSHNHSDSEYMCGLLSTYGYRLLPETEKEHADLWLVNSCTVKNPSQDHLASDVRRANALKLPIVVAGCVSQVSTSQHCTPARVSAAAPSLTRVLHAHRPRRSPTSTPCLGSQSLASSRSGGWWRSFKRRFRATQCASSASHLARRWSFPKFARTHL